MRILIFLFSLLLFHNGRVKAQASISITVTDERQQPLPGATIYLSGADSVTIFSKAADSKGIAIFMQLPAGRYRVRASQTGYVNANSAWIDLEQNNVSIQMILKAETAMLKAV